MVWSLSSVGGSHALQHGASSLKNFLKYYNSSGKRLTWYISLVQQHHPWVPFRPLEKFPSMSVNMETSSLPFKNFLNIDVDNNSSPPSQPLRIFSKYRLTLLRFLHLLEKFSNDGFFYDFTSPSWKFFYVWVLSQFISTYLEILFSNMKHTPTHRLFVILTGDLTRFSCKKINKLFVPVIFTSFYV